MPSRRMIALNNSGVDSLKSGRYQDAILCFRHAIHFLASHVEPECCDSCLLDAELTRSPLNVLDTCYFLTMSPNNMFDVYQGAFYLPKSDSVNEASLDVAVILHYNLGLAHHLAGLSGTRNFNAHLTEALGCYSLALKTYRSHIHATSNCFALILGCVTNIGHIYSHFWRVQEAKSCYQMLDAMLNCHDLQFLSIEDGEFFASTMAFCSTRDCKLAPAA